MGTIHGRKSRIRFCLAIFCGFLVSLLLASRVPAAARAGQLDTSFADQGIFLDHLSGATAAVVM